MPFVQADLDAIDQAIASGAREVQYADKKVVYNSIGALKEAKLAIMNELAGGKPRQSRRYGVVIND
jgi:hypothetical protein